MGHPSPAPRSAPAACQTESVSTICWQLTLIAWSMLPFWNQMQVSRIGCNAMQGTLGQLPAMLNMFFAVEPSPGCAGVLYCVFDWHSFEHHDALVTAEPGVSTTKHQIWSMSSSNACTTPLPANVLPTSPQYWMTSLTAGMKSSSGTLDGGRSPVPAGQAVGSLLHMHVGCDIIALMQRHSQLHDVIAKTPCPLVSRSSMVIHPTGGRLKYSILCICFAQGMRSPANKSRGLVSDALSTDAG